MKRLYFGDCLEVLKELCPNPHRKNNGFIDLIYIDPPFNSKRDYNVLFEDVDLSDANAQKKAFSDTWSNVSYYDSLEELKELDLNLFNFLNALNNINISKSAVSYLTMMAIRIFFMHKVLKETGSFYLHCDSTMSHYLKIVCDIIFNENNYRNEICWKRTSSIKTSQFENRKFSVLTDTILFYTKSNNYLFKEVKIPFTEKEIEERYPFIDEKGRFTKSPVFRSLSMGERPNLCYEYKGVNAPNKAGWKVSKEKLIEIDNRGDLGWSEKGIPYRKYRPEQTKGTLVTNLWDDIEQTGGSERLGYPTQKPEALLERIINSSTNENDLIADFFCGCGTTIAVAEKSNRQWLGVDISHLAVKLIKKRLTDKIENTTLRKEYDSTIEIYGFPKDVASARALARQDYDIENTESDKKYPTKNTKGRLQFQDWVIEIMLNAVCNPKRTADGGWDGHQVFKLPDNTKETVLIEVKSGNVNVKNVREFIQVVDSQKAAIGVFVCFGEQVTGPMLQEASKQGYYTLPNSDLKYQKIQILTVEDLINGQGIKMPDSSFGVFKKSLNNNGKVSEEQESFF
ncbi:MAG: DNA methyltransferase [Ignavibacteria bacterium]